MRKLKFYLIGLLPGLLIVFFVLNQKGAKCSGYLPNSRVLAETATKDFQYSPQFELAMHKENVTENFLRDSILTEGKINFDKSQAQLKPCPKYLLYYPAKTPKWEITFDKCEEEAIFQTLKRIK